jgi:hypothetical protein
MPLSLKRAKCQKGQAQSIALLHAWYRHRAKGSKAVYQEYSFEMRAECSMVRVAKIRFW